MAVSTKPKPTASSFEVSLALFPPPEPSTSSFLMESSPSTVSFASLTPGSSTASSSPRSPQPPPTSSLASHRLEDFKSSTYRDIVSKWIPLLAPVKENGQLQSALQAVLSGEKAREDMKSIVHFCNKAGGLLGHRNDLMSGPVDNVFTSLNTQSIPQRVKEIQAVQLMFEALLEFPHNLTSLLMTYTSGQRQKLLIQFQSTPLGTNVHGFCDKGAWVDPSLIPMLEFCGYRLTNSRLQLHRKLFTPKDPIRSATMAVLSIECVFDEKKLVFSYF